jgi:putative glutamine amidotransferase
MPPLIAVLANLMTTDAGEFATREVTNRPYIEALTAAGGIPFIVPCLADLASLSELLNHADGLLITGGPDVAPNLYGEAPHPALGQVVPPRDLLDRLTLAYLHSRPTLPVLGICRGIQSMAVFNGAPLVQDLPAQVPEALQHNQKAPGYHGSHELTVRPGTLLHELIGSPRVMVNSFHHQAVRQAPAGWVASAHTADGVIEALEDPRVPFCLGVQFHPELMAPQHPPLAALFTRLVEAAARPAG